jgi:ABC-type branched-subunit amino acid transport system substrate-binding protein
MIIYSAAPNTVVSDEDSQNGRFISELLKSIRLPNTTVEQAFSRTRNEVSKATKREQIPWVSSSVTDDIFINADKSPSPVSTPTTTNTSTPSTNTAAAKPSALPSASSRPSEPSQKTYNAGVSGTEIKIGNIAPYTGPASAYGVIANVEKAYFDKINAEGGINGRKITFISYDDAYSPPKTVEQARKLVESDEVLLIFNPLGTPTNSAIQRYLNAKQVPQLFVASAAGKWSNPKDFPWTMGFQPSYRVEARIFAKYILKGKPNAKVALFYQNDDFGKEYVAGLKEIFGDKATSLIVAEESYAVTEPSIDSHIVKLKDTGADVLINISTPKFAAQAIKKISELEWKPMHVMASVSTSISGVLAPAGFAASEGILSVSYLKNASDPQWRNDDGVKKFRAFLEKYMPGANVADASLSYGYAVAHTMVQVLKQCGDDLTRENVMKQAADLKDFVPDTLMPGIKVNTSASDFAPIEQLKMMRFKGNAWEQFGDVMSAETKG